MIVLDTNVISEMMRKDPNPGVIEWLNRQPVDQVWITTISVFENCFGIERLAQGRRRERLEGEFQAVVDVDLSGRVIDFDRGAAEAAARIGAELQGMGRPIPNQDLLIAGIVVSRQATLATRNVRHFEGVDIRLVDPWGA